MCIRSCLLATLLLIQLWLPGQAAAGGPALRTCNASQGIGGTGAPTEHGIGGTGTLANSGGGEDGGIGGTGVQAQSSGGDGSGIGGTGIQVAGKIADSIGTVMAVDRGQQVFMLAKGDAICPGDRLETGAQASAKIVFADGATLYLKSATQIHLIDYAWSEKAPEQSRFELALSEGGLRSVSGKLSHANPGAYQLKSPDSQISVLGTDYQVVYVKTPHDDMEAGTYASVASGRIRLENNQGVLILKAGESAMVRLNQPPALLRTKPGCLPCR